MLLENSASPLQQLLETTELGSAPSPLCGLEDSLRELVFCCGIEGSEAEHVDAFEAQVLAVLEEIAANGVPREQLEAVLHQLELHQREVSGDGMPYGLNLILQALGPATHYADPIAVLDLDPVIDELRERISDPAYIRGLAQRLLLDNAHRVTLVMSPDKALSERRSAAERERLASLRQTMSDSDCQQVIAQTHALLERQGQQDDPEILPKVTLEDVPATVPELSYSESEIGGRTVTCYEQGTNGLVYQQLSCRLPDMSSAELALLPQLTAMAAELGVGSDDYLATQRRQSAHVGSINLFTSMRGAVHSEQDLSASLVLSSKALHRQADEQAGLMAETLTALRFDELPRIRDLVAQQRARREQSLVGQGHSLAMHAACAAMSPLARLHHELSGLAGVAALRRLDERLASDSELQTLAGDLQALYERLRQSDWEALIVAEPGTTASLAERSTAAWAALPNSAPADLNLGELRGSVRECWVVNSQVSFCAAAYPTVPVGHEDAAALTVLAGYLRNGYLHRAIREQGGAYGGGASHDASVAAFRFYSYRDPRISGTLEDFDASLDWLREAGPDPRALEEAILGVVGSLDKPGSPAGEAKQDFHNRRFGRDHTRRMQFRQRILGVTFADLLRVVNTYLRPECASLAVVTGAAALDQDRSVLEERQLELREL